MRETWEHGQTIRSARISKTPRLVFGRFLGRVVSPCSKRFKRIGQGKALVKTKLKRKTTGSAEPHHNRITVSPYHNQHHYQQFSHWTSCKKIIAFLCFYVWLLLQQLPVAMWTAFLDWVILSVKQREGGAVSSLWIMFRVGKASIAAENFTDCVFGT